MYFIDIGSSTIRYRTLMNTKKAYKLDSVGIVLRQYRNLANVSQEKVGERMGVSGDFISRLELGQEYPSIGMLIRFALAVEARPGEVLDAIAEREGLLPDSMKSQGDTIE